MTNINTSPEVVTVVITVSTDPEQMDRLLSLVEQLQEVAKGHSGFISATTHTSLVSCSIMVHQQWVSQKAYEAFLVSEKRQAGLREVKNFIDAGHASELDWHRYRVSAQVTA